MSNADLVGPAALAVVVHFVRQGAVGNRREVHEERLLEPLQRQAGGSGSGGDVAAGVGPDSVLMSMSSKCSSPLHGRTPKNRAIRTTPLGATIVSRTVVQS